MNIGYDIIYYENLPSTNTHAANLLKVNAVTEGTIIRTSFQSAGKGQMCNRWESEQGKNLLISIILYPFMIEPEEQFLLSMMVSLGICDYLEREISGCKIKWPNDIYVNNDKIAGILIENSIMDDAIVNSVAGIGLNVNQIDFQSDAPNPVSMSMVTGKYYDLDVCIGKLAGALDKRYHQLMAGEQTRIRRDYASRLYRLNEWFDFRDEISTFRGRILSVRDNGILQIETDNRSLKEYSFKEIEFIL